MKTPKLLLNLLAVLAFSASVTAYAATFVAGDLVASPSQVNGFEAITDATFSGSIAHTEQGIKVQQVNGDTDSSAIWSTYGASLGFVGERSWYANGGDSGYTKITMADGSNFSDVSIMTGNGWSSANSVYLNYSLWDNGVEVLSGSSLQNLLAYSVSFLGGGFDMILLSATYGSANGVLSGAYQALAIDQIKTGVSAVPLPAALPLMLSGLGMLGFVSRGRKNATV